MVTRFYQVVVKKFLVGLLIPIPLFYRVITLCRGDFKYEMPPGFNELFSIM
jgi:hypothetical protein